MRATIRRGRPWMTQSTHYRYCTPPPQSPYVTTNTPASITITGWKYVYFYKWDVAFTDGFGFLNKSYFSHREAMQYATRMVRKVRSA